MVEKIYAPVDTADFAPYFARIQQANPDAVLGIWTGAAAVRFLKQYSDFGMKQKYPLLGFGPMTDESILPAAGPTAQGVISYYNYSPSIDSPDNKRFVEAYRKRFKQSNRASSPSAAMSRRARSSRPARWSKAIFRIWGPSCRR